MVLCCNHGKGMIQIVINVNYGKMIKLACIVRMHLGKLGEIEEAHAGNIAAMFGIDQLSMDTISIMNRYFGTLF